MGQGWQGLTQQGAQPPKGGTRQGLDGRKQVVWQGLITQQFAGKTQGFVHMQFGVVKHWHEHWTGNCAGPGQNPQPIPLLQVMNSIDRANRPRTNL